MINILDTLEHTDDNKERYQSLKKLKYIIKHINGGIDLFKKSNIQIDL